ncbi:Cytochrome b-c1 complex subunit 6, mitochondrial [Trichoplax sp. H2]|uniref:Ubiquinol-cytochrome C reductase hinge domain-containing protein n=1 Tax=Trichoplax adhaerens TaxID=10228 RepID=B3RIF7_TRIAD|nr:expressed hypothetical protein [Trichoplax adhaerens]EDV29226.1 expressed hypothetical protein [Trichoplax adhaerens]RDD40897.1 Cytochrome b-c1 complex subunit 6, mitochondrial [Trichoplax sp. H2]|eukprot:XP_002108428.1 expressed hypothetical protein [Trichoplax adhaerens]
MAFTEEEEVTLTEEVEDEEPTEEPEEEGGDVEEEEGGNAEEEEEEEEEEGPIDPKPILFEECGESPKCAPLKSVYETCNDRVNSRSNTEETCTQELFDFMHCADKCVAKTLFSRLK